MLPFFFFLTSFIFHHFVFITCNFTSFLSLTSSAYFPSSFPFFGHFAPPLSSFSLTAIPFTPSLSFLLSASFVFFFWRLFESSFLFTCVTSTPSSFFWTYRWKRFEIHDIVIECAKVSLDPREASCEEGYATLPEHFCANLHMRAPDCTASPYTDLHSSYGTFFSAHLLRNCLALFNIRFEVDECFHSSTPIGSSSSNHFSTPRQSVLPPLPLSSLPGTQPAHRSPPSTHRPVSIFYSFCKLSLWETVLGYTVPSLCNV